MEIPKEAPKNKFIETNQLQEIFKFNSMPTIQKAIDKSAYYHISGEVLGAYCSENDSIIAQNFRDKEELYMLKGYYKPIGIIEVNDSTFKNLPESTNFKQDGLISSYKSIYVIFDISKAKIDGYKPSHENLMVCYKNLYKILYGSDIYAYDEIVNKIDAEGYCKNIKKRTFNIDYKKFSRN